MTILFKEINKLSLYMKLLYLVNLFIVCTSAFIITPSNSLLLKNNMNIYRCHSSNIFYKKYQLFKEITNSNLLKKNNNDDKNNDNIQILTINIIYNLILYSYIYYLIISKHH